MAYQTDLCGNVIDALDDPEKLAELYHEDGYSLRELAEQFDCHHTTVRKAMDEHGIERRPSSGAPPKTSHAPFCQHPRGYEMWVSDHEPVLVHRLLAVSEYGFDAVADSVIHHENDIPWDNRPENITPMDPEKHAAMHVRGYDPATAGSI